MNTANLTTPARVTRVKASHPAPQYSEEGDDRPASGNTPMFLAAASVVVFPLLMVGVVALVGYLIKN